MQTIGETTNKMNFPLTWTDILLKSISGKTNYTIDVKIGTKRITTDNQDPREIPKKRRKQSNPTRISSNEKNMNSGFDAKLLSSGRNKNQLNHVEPEKDLELINECTSTPSPLNLTKSDTQRLPSSELKQSHFSSNIQQKSELGTKVLQNSSTSYQPFTKTIPYFEKKDTSTTESSACIISSFKHQPINSASNIGLSSVQIFNPEAFCDQCNKEFCNKYFLKTHKANKHGVFIDGQPNSSIIDQLDRHKISTLSMPNDYSPKINDVSNNASTSLLFRSPGLFSQPIVNTNVYVSKSVINNQTRAFCNICHKEFCNKYFVKRHKSKIHGIIDDGDYKTTDDVPLNFKTNLEIKNEFLDFENSEACDKDEKIESSSFHVHEPALSKVHAKLCTSDTQTSIEGDEHMIKSILVETSCDNIKVELSDDEENVNYINKLPNELSNTINYIDNELTNSSTDIININISEHSAIQNEFFKPNVENMTSQLTDFRNTTTPINLIVNNSDHNILTNNSLGKKINEFNNPKDCVKMVENSKGIINKNTDTHETRTEMISKSKLLTLHNLFFKLNGCTQTQENMTKCYVCNIHVEGSLKTHIFDKHENLIHELINESLEPSGNVRTDYLCQECQQTFSSDALLKAHIEQCECNVKGLGRASTSSKNSAENDEYVRYSKESGERKQSTMLSSFCKICNKELCNKYFMKTHMQRMHGISIQNGNHIGGVVCDICNKELCSKYFLRVHKQNSHGIVENGVCPKFWPDSMAENGLPSDELDSGHRYYKHYTEVCNICFRRFRSAKWLSAHLLNDHGDEGKMQLKHIQKHLEDEKLNLQANNEVNNVSCMTNSSPKPNAAEDSMCDEMKQYRCSYCSFTTSILSFLFVHEKFHLTDSKTTEDTSLTCSTCCVTFQNKTQLENHFAHCHFNKGSENSQASLGVPRSPDNTHIVLNTNEDSSADKSLDTNGNDVFMDKLGPSIKPCQTENASLSTGKEHSIPESNHEPFIMQSFFLENCSVSPSVKTELSSDSFHSSLVYLPVKEKLTSTVNVFFKLTPT